MGKRRLVFVAAVLISAPGCLGGSSAKPPASTTVPPVPQVFPQPPPPKSFHAVVPRGFTKQPAPKSSVDLALLTRGTSPEPGCPAPIYLVRTQANPGGTLGLAVNLYNEFEQARRPLRRILAQRRAAVRGMQQATLILATYPANGKPGGTQIRTYDLLGLGRNGVAYHVYAAGCAQSFPVGFVTDDLLRFAATATRS
jgi:hypothetical protein